MLRIPLADMQLQFNRILQREGFRPNDAERCAQIFTENSLVGVASHGLNRFPGFVEFVRRGLVQPHAKPTLEHNMGAWEQWNGNLGPGPLNAYAATERAMELARQHGVGCVGLRNTNHWMRGGYYGWMAAQAGLALVSWTNTKPNMPPWGAVDSHVGNNPLVLAVPKPNGPVVLDMAMSQFSIGRMEGTARAGGTLPLPGGFDGAGNLSTDPGAILAADRALPIGYWKGSGLALLLDLVAALLAGGLTTYEIGQQETEYGVSQVFIAFDVTRAGGAALVNRAVEDAIADLHAAIPVAAGDSVLYPGERALHTRAENLEKGIPVEASIWQRVLGM